MQPFLETLEGVHRFEIPTKTGGGRNYLKEIEKRYMESVHPPMTVHPMSKEKILFVITHFLDETEGLTPNDSRALLELLWEHIVRLEYTVRYNWHPGDVAAWDNLSTAHLAPSDIFDTDFDRQLYRVALVGDIPVGVDGRVSRSLHGEPIPSAEQELRLRAS